MQVLQVEHTMLADTIERAYRQGTGQWTGCDWPTEFGTTRLNLNGLKADQALLLARATSGPERSDWQAAVEWLSRVEQDARVAEDLARKVLELALSGQLVGAIFHVDSACRIEAKYHSRLVWQPLREALAGTRAPAPG